MEKLGFIEINKIIAYDHNENKALACFVLPLPYSICYQLCAIYVFVIIDSNCSLMYFLVKV